MPKQFIVKGETALRVGTFVSKTASGYFILEFPFNQVEVHRSNNLDEVVPYTFLVKSKTSVSHNHHYTLPQSKSVSKGDLLLTTNGQLVEVVAVDTKFVAMLLNSKENVSSAESKTPMTRSWSMLLSGTWD